MYIRAKSVADLQILLQIHLIFTVEPRFNEVAGDWPNLFVKSRFVISKTSI